MGVTGEQLEVGIVLGAGHLIDGTVLGVDQRRQLREEHLADRHQVTLALEHTRELGEVGFEPVLFLVCFGGDAQVPDHGVDVVLEFSHFAAGLDGDGAREVALGDGRGDFGDGPDLGGQVGGQQVDVAR